MLQQQVRFAGAISGAMMKRISALVLPLAAASLAPLPVHAQQAGEAQAEPAPAPAATIYDAQIVARYPHDPAAFTQGLLWHDGQLYESTGLEGQSQIRRVDLATGDVLAAQAIPADQFGEGVALWGDELVSLTWMDRVIHRWSLDTLELVRSDPFPFEGWGLTAMDGMLVASDGSATLRFLDPETYAVEHEVTVTLDGRPIARLNELEAADGLIWANQWYSQVIVGIDPADGTIRRIVDLSPLVAEIDAAQNGAVLNGIAHDPASDRWFVTGKLWPTMFEVRLVPREAEPDASATGG
ncbi:glutaminyl-peptide cyclotransferase [Citromicrobium bathyomarinum]